MFAVRMVLHSLKFRLNLCEFLERNEMMCVPVFDCDHCKFSPTEQIAFYFFRFGRVSSHTVVPS